MLFAHQGKVNKKQIMGLLMTYAMFNGVVKGQKTYHRIIFLAHWEEIIYAKHDDLNCYSLPSQVCLYMCMTTHMPTHTHAHICY